MLWPNRHLKPPPWAFNPELIDLSWTWFWRKPVMCLPFWQQSPNTLEDLADKREWYVSDDLVDAVHPEMATTEYGPAVLAVGSGSSGDRDLMPVSTTTYSLALTDPDKFTFLIFMRTGSSLASRYFLFGQDDGASAVQIETGNGNGATNGLTFMVSGSYRATANNALSTDTDHAIVMGADGSNGHFMWVDGVARSLSTNNTPSYATASSLKGLWTRTFNATPATASSWSAGQRFYLFALYDGPPSQAMATQFHADPFGMLRMAEEMPAWFVPAAGGTNPKGPLGMPLSRPLAGPVG